MHLKLVSLINLIICFSAISAQVDEEPITIGSRYNIESKILNEKRPISVYLPRTYNRSESASYDVLYLLDGAVNLMHTAGSQYFLAGYRQMPELIIVGIHNTNRNRDLTPSAVAKVADSGGAKKFRKFIRSELFPFIDGKYRTTNNRYLSGHSYGGLFALDTLAESPTMFKAYFTFSPSLRWDNDLVLNKLTSQLKDNNLNNYLYVNIGDEGLKLKRPVLVLHEALKTQPNNQLRWKVDWLKNENHSTTPVIGQFLAYRDYFSNSKNN